MQEDLLFGVYLVEVSLNCDKMSKFESADNLNMWSILLNSRKDGMNKRKNLFFFKNHESRKYRNI